MPDRTRHHKVAFGQPTIADLVFKTYRNAAMYVVVLEIEAIDF